MGLGFHSLSTQFSCRVARPVVVNSGSGQTTRWVVFGIDPDADVKVTPQTMLDRYAETSRGREQKGRSRFR